MKVSQKVVRQFQSQLLACGFWPLCGLSICLLPLSYKFIF